MSQVRKPAPRITLVHAEELTHNQLRKKVIICPHRFKKLKRKCEELFRIELNRICLAPELGGGEIDDIEVINKDDVLYVYGRQLERNPNDVDNDRSSQGSKGSRSSKHSQNSSGGGASSSSKEASTTSSSTGSRKSTKSSKHRSPHLNPILSASPSSSNLHEHNTLRQSIIDSKRILFRHDLLKAKSDQEPSMGRLFFVGTWASAIRPEVEAFLSAIDQSRGVPLPSAVEAFTKTMAAHISGNPAQTNSIETLRQIPGIAADNIALTKCADNAVAAISVISDTGRMMCAASSQIPGLVLGKPNNATSVESTLVNRIAGDVIKLSLGALHGAAITRDGETLLTFGCNINCSTLGVKGEQNKAALSRSATPKHEICGQLGIGKDTELYMPPTAVPGIQGKILDVSCGGAHTLCLTTVGLYAWGLNDEGQLGHTDPDHYTPKLSRFTFNCNKILSVAAGAHHSGALTKEGRLFMWGWNTHGQLGLIEHANPGGSSGSLSKVVSVTEPALVTVLAQVQIVKISLGTLHSAAISNNGQLYTWGDNQFGQLGRKKQAGPATPTTPPNISHSPSMSNMNTSSGSLPTATRGNGILRRRLFYEPVGFGVPGLVDLKRQIASELDCGPFNTLVITLEGLALMCGQLAEENFQNHAKRFRLFKPVLREDIFLTSGACGSLHYVLLEDRLLTNVLSVFLQACAFKSFPIMDFKRYLYRVPPTLLSKVQNRALKRLGIDNSKYPSFSIDTALLELGQEFSTDVIEIRNNSKQRINIVPNLTSEVTDLPQGCSLSISSTFHSGYRMGNQTNSSSKENPVITAKPNSTTLIYLNLEGATPVDSLTFFTLTVFSVDPKRGPGESLLSFIPLLLRGSKIKHTNAAVSYTVKQLSALLSQKDQDAVHTRLPSMAPTQDLKELFFLDRKYDELTAEEFNLHEILGSGGSGTTVFRAEVVVPQPNVQTVVAVKILDVTMTVKFTIDSCINEIRILNHLRHPNIVYYYGHFLVDTKLHLFLEYMPLTLAKFIEQNNNAELELHNLTLVVKEVAKALRYIHSQNVLWRDLKAGNVLIKLSPDSKTITQVKCMDFDSSREIRAQDELVKTVVGTPQFTAPEVYVNKGYTSKVDVWSFGLLIFQVLTGFEPWIDVEPHKLLGVIKGGEKPKMKEGTGQGAGKEEYVVVMNECLEVEAEKRPTSEEVCRKLGCEDESDVEADGDGGGKGGKFHHRRERKSGK